MRTFDYFYGLRLVILLLRYSDNLGVLLQTKNLGRIRTDENLRSILGRCETQSWMSIHKNCLGKE